MIILIGVFLTGLQVSAADACFNLFHDATQKAIVIERRNSSAPFAFTPRSHNENQVIQSPILPQKTRLVYSFENGIRKLYKESIITVTKNGVVTEKVLSIEIPLDLNLPFVIDATISVARDFYDEVITQGHGVVIFLDVNDLGWVNNNFLLKSKAGDEFLKAVHHAIQNVTHKNGLVFRIGGDEIAMVIPMMRPEEINTVLKTLATESTEFAQSIFTREWLSRREAHDQAYAKRFEAQADPAHFTPNRLIQITASTNRAYDQYVRLYNYMQPSVSIGATYTGTGQSAKEIQQQVEGNAHPHKIAIKKSTRKPIDKYVSDPSMAYYEYGPMYILNYEFPILPDRTLTTVTVPPRFNFKRQQVEWDRKRILYHIGPYNISEFKPEFGPTMLKVEYYENQALKDVQDLYVNKHTGMIDAKTLTAQKLIANLYQNLQYKAIWINLLNLGKLNYFKDKSETGNRALTRVSEIIKGFLDSRDIAFKLMGSEFLVFIETTSMVELIDQINTLFNSDLILRKIYLDQINHLEITGAHPEKIAEVQKLLDEPLIKIELRAGRRN